MNPLVSKQTRKWSQGVIEENGKPAASRVEKQQ